MPKISVIVPAYNVEKYLPRCIDSILNQTFTDFELILVDDGSPDRCPAICDEYVLKDNRIKVIHKQNGGLSAARNAGIDWAFANSDSQYLSFVDSDDWVHPNFLEYLYKAIREHDVQISVCNVERTQADTIVWNIQKIKSEFKNALEFYMENNVWATVAWNKLYTKEIFKNYRYPVGKLHEDEFLTYKLLYDAKNIAWIEQTMYEYFQRSDSIMGTATPDRLKILEELKNEHIKFWRIHKEKALLYWARSSLVMMYYSILMNPDNYGLTTKITNNIRKKLGFTLFRYGKKTDFSFKKHCYLYELAFPRTMRIYWLAIATKNKVQKNGIVNTIIAVTKRIFNKKER